MFHKLTGAFWRKSALPRHRPASHLDPSTQGKPTPNPAPGRYRLHREAFSQVPHTPSSSASGGEEEPVVKDGLLRLVAMGMEGVKCCIHRGHGKGSRDPW